MFFNSGGGTNNVNIPATFGLLCKDSVLVRYKSTIAIREIFSNFKIHYEIGFEEWMLYKYLKFYVVDFEVFRSSSSSLFVDFRIFPFTSPRHTLAMSKEKRDPPGSPEDYFLNR